MDEPNLINIILRGLFLLLGALSIPQVGGAFSLRWAWRKQKKIMLIPALLVAPAIFFVTAYVFWEMRADSISAEGHYVCGAFGAAAFFSTVLGAVFHLVLSGGVLFFIWFTAKRQNTSTKAK